MFNERGRFDQSNLFSTETSRGLKEAGYLIFRMRGCSLKQLEREFSLVLYESQTFEEGPGNVDAGIKNQSFWEEISISTEVAVKPGEIFLPSSTDKSIQYHNQMVEQFSKKLSRKFKGVEAVIGPASSYVELAAIYKTHTSESFFYAEGEKLFTVSSTKYEPDLYHRENEFLIEVGEADGVTRCSTYRLSLQGKYGTGVIPLIIPTK